MKVLRHWKKVLENDLDYIVSEMKDAITPPAVVILSGPVGAGKTTFTKRFVKLITGPGVASAPPRAQEYEVLSPTYSIINETGNLAHADLYRIKDKEELVHLEIPLYLENKDFFLVEWGRPYLAFLKREIDERFKFYDLEISTNPAGEGVEKATEGDVRDLCSRNFILSEIS
ncbi:MAG: hypothetical protein A2X86_11535 [Bdellovibrionales bacterium GWA2_49_15]|nr:MAG: hypothetical protein A2X86_11535 [Bdellovibrionales bacterium GWA2_49_15]HAZ12617.1 hypothetical protein [Bdellovibrionales bacterium]